MVSEASKSISRQGISKEAIPQDPDVRPTIANPVRYHTGLAKSRSDGLRRCLVGMRVSNHGLRGTAGRRSYTHQRVVTSDAAGPGRNLG